MKIDIAICSYARPTEVALLLQALRTQSYQDFDIYIYDDRCAPPMQQVHFVMCLLNRLKIENHRVIILRNEVRIGVSRLRQKIIDYILEKGRGELILSIDDDVIPQQDYLEKLINGIKQGYDIISGVTPPIMHPSWKRNIKHIKPYVDNIELDKEGNIIRFDDNCGYEFIEDELIPALHYRSGALFKKEIFKVCKFPEDLGFCSFREEEFVAWQAHLNNFKFAICTGAVVYHQLTPSGGNRNNEYQQNIQRNVNKHNEYTKELFNKHGDFIAKAKEKIK